MKINSSNLRCFIIVFFILTSAVNGYSQKFDDEYSYEKYINNTNYLNLIKETSDTVYHQELIDNPSQKIIKISNKAIGNIIYYFNTILEMVDINEEDDMVKRFKKFDDDTIDKLHRKLAKKFNLNQFNYNSYIFSYLRHIIFNMLDIDHTNKYSLKKIYVFIVELINNI